MLNLLTRTIEESKDDAPFMDAHPQEVRRIKSWLETRVSAAKQLGAEGLLSECVTITPAQAQHILANYNIGNRPIRRTRVDQWAQTIRDGRFMLTSQGISFSRSGRLNNGQHRLSGIVAAGVPVRVMVTFGEDEDAFAILDTGAIRSGSDVLDIEGAKNSTVVSATLRSLARMERKDFSANRNVGGDMLVELYRDNPGIEDVASDAMRIAHKIKGAPTPICLALFLIKEGTAQLDKYDIFVERLATGVDLKERSPLLKLREGLRNKQFALKGYNGSLKVFSTAAAVINAWNGFVRNRPVALAWKPGDHFPKPE